MDLQKIDLFYYYYFQGVDFLVLQVCKTKPYL